MTNIDLPDRAPPRTPQKPARRPAPCAGLFGWRKEAAPRPPDKDKPRSGYPLA
ncbi:hypothetical protein [Sphingopyxis lindanitolerans]|uniref:hypothetical protein n=1 Tax=Sphingopyxis lindanitolerans TaxID=2054227 RepID=UPI00130504B0|nr:hypothetical protein [Sphingopyxis lindanitolerans]